jgi:hypothetical protein
MAQDEYGNEIPDPEQQQQQQQQPQGATNQIAAQIPGPKSRNENASSWLNWIHSAYGDSASRGGGFADTNQDLNSVVDRYNRETGSQAKFMGGPSGDRVDFGNGAEDVKTGEGQLWFNYGPGGPPGQKPGAGSGGGGGGGGSYSGGGGTGSGGYLNDRGGKSNALYDLLMKRATQSTQVDPNDPIIKGQTDAYDAQGQQARRNFLAASAEKEGPYGNAASESRRSAEELGKSTGAFQAQAMQHELDARRREIEGALSGAQGLLTDEQRISLQEELSKMQMNQQNDQFGRSLAQGQSQFNANLGQRGYEFDTSRYDNLFG